MTEETKKKRNILKWITRSLAIAILVFGLPFYFGYGNPLPFTNPDYNAWDNLWLTVFPIMFIGLILGFRFPKIGGYMTSISIALGLIIGLIISGEFIYFMLVPCIVGILFIIDGYRKRD